ncbi:MAG: hypothetical protein AAF989_01635 [Planctomycetota bacterium]
MDACIGWPTLRPSCPLILGWHANKTPVAKPIATAKATIPS